MTFINIFTFCDFQPSFVTNYTLSGKAMPPMDAVVEKIKDALTQDKIRRKGFVSIKLFSSCVCFLNFLCCCGYIFLAFLSVFHVMLLINCVSLHISLFSTTFFVFFFFSLCPLLP